MILIDLLISQKMYKLHSPTSNLSIHDLSGVSLPEQLTLYHSHPFDDESQPLKLYLPLTPSVKK